MLKRVRITSMDLLAELMQEPLKEGKSVKFTVVGNSMYPLLRNGLDNVLVSSNVKPKKFDIILYRRKSGDYVLHRIVRVGKEGFGLCGDNQLLVEYPVRQEDVVAVVTAIERKGKLVPVTKLWYRAYSVLWSLLIPLRPVIFKVSCKIKHFFTKGK